MSGWEERKNFGYAIRATVGDNLSRPGIAKKLGRPGPEALGRTALLDKLLKARQIL